MNRKKKLFSLLLVVAMIVTAVSTNVFSAFAEESVDLSQFIDKNLPSDVVDRSYIKIGDHILQPNIENKIPYGSTISIKLVWGFIDNQFPTKDNNTMVYQLPDGITMEEGVKDLKDGTETVGHFKVIQLQLNIMQEIKVNYFLVSQIDMVHLLSMERLMIRLQMIMKVEKEN